MRYLLLWLFASIARRHSFVVAMRFFFVTTFVLGGTSATHSQEASGPGVVIEEVHPVSTLQKAGVRPGDLLLRWQRLANPPANPDADQGEIRSVLDWEWLVTEQAPRGIIRLEGRRGDEVQHFEVNPGSWEAQVRPRMTEELLSNYRRAAEARGSEDWEKAGAAWNDIAGLVEKYGTWELSHWISLQLADMWSKAGNLEESQKLYLSAIKHTPEPASQAIILQIAGAAHQEAGNLDAARQAFEEVLSVNIDAKEATLISAKSFNRIGWIHYLKGEIDLAQEYIARAFESQQRLCPSSVELARSLNNLAALAQLQSNFELADQYYNQALEIRQRITPDGPGLASVTSNLCSLKITIGDIDSAEELCQRSLGIHQNIDPESIDTANALSDIGIVAIKRGDLSDAERLIGEALQIYNRKPPSGYALGRALSGLGNVAYVRGDLEKSEGFYKQAADIVARMAPSGPEYASMLNNLGNIAYERGDLETAENIHRQALEIRQHLLPGTMDESYSFTNLGLVESERINFNKAISYYKKALEVQRVLAPESETVAATSNNLANVYWARGEFRDAEDLYMDVLRIRNAIAPSGTYTASALGNLANLKLDQGELDAAVDYYRRSLDIYRMREEKMWNTTRTLANLGEAERRRGNIDRALDHLQEASEMAKELPFVHDITANILRDMGRIYQKSQPLRAAELFLNAVKITEEKAAAIGGASRLQTEFRIHSEGMYRLAIMQLSAVGREKEAFGVMELYRARGFLMMLAERDLMSIDIPVDLDAARRGLAVRYDRAQQRIVENYQNESADTVEDHYANVRKLRQEAEEIENTIRRVSPKLASLRYPQPADFSGIRQSLDDGTAMLSYSVGEEQTLLFVLSADSDLEVYAISVSSKDLQGDIRQIQHLLPASRLDTPIGVAQLRTLRALNEKLFETFVRPAAPILEQNERLVILPDGPLHYLPWGALIKKENSGDVEKQEYLVEWKPFHVVLSATVYAEIKQMRRSETKGPVSLAAFGDPRYPHAVANSGRAVADIRLRRAVERGFDYRLLPATRREVESIAGIFPEEVQTFLGIQATEETAREAVGDVRYLHFATHGLLDEHIPLNSGLVLSIPEELHEGQYNGLLQAWEIIERVRLDADLVTLSACESGLGQRFGGDGLIGLTRAFQYAGARTVAASLWSVSDETTAELMVRFYRYLREGHTKDKALQAAQIDLIRQPIRIQNEHGEMIDKDASAPYYWAAFQLYGDWR